MPVHSFPTKKRVLVAALDWGLGHATRCVPLISDLLERGNEVTLASSGSALEYFRITFPQLTILEKPGYGIRYSKGKSQALKLIFQVPFIGRTIMREHTWLSRLIAERKIDCVYSDNCYGLWNRKIKTVLITHQLSVKCPHELRFTEPLVNRLLQGLINRFDECLVPDLEGADNYAGELSHPEKLPLNVRYSGLMSRFNNKVTFSQKQDYDVLAILSGPEPQRTILEEKLAELFKQSSHTLCIVRGLPGVDRTRESSENITWMNHAGDEELVHLFSSAGMVVSRSGYSTIMDLAVLGVPAILVPTPGQSEQEYLAMHNQNRRQFSFITQEKLSLEKILEFREAIIQEEKSLGIEDNIRRGEDVALMQRPIVNKDI